MLSHVVDLTRSLSTPPNSRRDDQTHAQLASPVHLVDVDAVRDNAVEVVFASQTRAERNATSEVSHTEGSVAHGKTKCEPVRPCRLVVGIDPDTFGALVAIEEDSQRVHIIPMCHVINGSVLYHAHGPLPKRYRIFAKTFLQKTYMHSSKHQVCGTIVHVVQELLDIVKVCGKGHLLV